MPSAGCTRSSTAARRTSTAILRTSTSSGTEPSFQRATCRTNIFGNPVNHAYRRAGGREVTFHEILDTGVEDDPQRDRAHSGSFGLQAGSEVAHRKGHRVADLLRGEDDHRGARDGEGRMGAAGNARDDEGDRRSIREAERRAAAALERAARLALERHARLLRKGKAGVANGVELPLRHRSPSRPDHDLSAPDGCKGSPDLWAEWRRTVAMRRSATLGCMD